MTLQDALKLEAKYQKQTIIKFSVYMSLIIVAMLLLFIFTNCFQKYPVIYSIFLILVFVAGKYSKVYYLVRPKEFTGVIKYSNVTVERVRKYASHQPGVSFSRNEVHMLDIIIENDNKRIRRTIEYDWHWGEFFEGQTVTILRFTDRPFLIAEPK